MNLIALLRILLLEDSPLDADLIIDWLNSDSFDCRVECVQSREDYLAALRGGTFDLLLSDYSLPGFDGIEALELAQEMRPQLPFIFVSGHLGEELAIDTLKRGATDYVLKGRLERLAPAVKRALREAQERSARQRIETTLQILSEASLLLSSLDYSTTLTQIAHLVVPHFADYCLVDVVADDNSIERVAVAHADPEREPLVRQLLDYPPSPDSHHPIWKVLRSGQSQLLPEVSDALLETATRDERHLEIVRKLGFCSTMIIPLLAEGRTLGVMSLILDTNERSYSALDLSLAEDLARRCAMAVEKARLRRQTLDALRARDEFLAVLSHELRSPLTAILGWTHLLQSQPPDESTLAHGLQVIERNTKTQAQFIEDLLEVSRIITGQLELELLPVNVSEIVGDVVTSLAPTCRAKGVELWFSGHDVADGVLGDAPRLRQVVANLISNAVKFTPKGGRVEVALGSEDGYVSLIVRDSGEGIAPEFLPFLFDRFRQADSSSTRRHGGLGLGLSIVRHLTEMHGGTVHAASPGLGQGATFTVRLPMLASSAVPAVIKPPTSELRDSDTASLDGLNVLLVEDGDDARELLATILRRMGAHVTPAASAQEAVTHLNTFNGNEPDVMVSDIAMPGEDGYSLLRRVKAWEAEHLRRLPVVALTAYAGEHDRAEALATGFSMHLAKPVEAHALVAAVANLARTASSHSQATN